MSRSVVSFRKTAAISVLAAALGVAGFSVTAFGREANSQSSSLTVAKASGYMKGYETLFWVAPSLATSFVLYRDGVQVSTAGPAATSARFLLQPGTHTISAVAILQLPSTTTTATVPGTTTTPTTTTGPVTTTSSTPPPPAPPAVIPNALGPIGQHSPSWSDTSKWRSDSASLVASLATAVSTAPLSVGSYGVAYVVATSSDPLVSVTNTHACWGTVCGTSQWRIPAAAKPAAGGDAHLSVMQPDGSVLDLWNAAHTSASTWTAGAIAIAKPGVYSYPVAGARGSSLTSMSGVVTPDEVKADVIPHALALTLPSAVVCKCFVAPSTATDGVQPTGIPEGARLVLDPSYNIAGLSGVPRLIAQALKDYGGIVVDKDGAQFEIDGEAPESWTAFGQPDPWAALGVTGTPDMHVTGDMIAHMKIAA